MESECSIDAQFANEISALLKSPSSLQVQEYYDQLLRTRQCSGIKVKQDGEFGKCICADMEFGEGNLILKDQMLVGSQHSSNKVLKSCTNPICPLSIIEFPYAAFYWLQKRKRKIPHKLF